ncbi:MAG: nucleotidyltransferase domain-containing protein [Campylobacterales bacterium]|nr:nucleotidyltransferase domain-containing protein [Campylobacterales bacterium]
MNKQQILTKLKELKPLYEKDGFIIKGIFGSVARDEQNENSDIDILYDLTPEFTKRHIGFYAVGRLEDIKDELKKIFDCDIDLATIDSNSKVFQETIKQEGIYV